MAEGEQIQTAGPSHPGNAAPPPEKPTQWWQWMLLYPTLAVSLLTAIPEWMDKYQAYKLGVSSKTLDAANEQNQLWQKNLECTKTLDFRSVTNPHNIQVGAHVCPTGDLLVLIKHPGTVAPQYRWVGFNTFLVAGSLISPAVAYAATPEIVLAQDLLPRVINQRWLQPGLLKQRLAYPNGACFDVVVNTYTGAVVSQAPTACNSPF